MSDFALLIKPLHKYLLVQTFYFLLGQIIFIMDKGSEKQYTSVNEFPVNKAVYLNRTFAKIKIYSPCKLQKPFNGNIETKVIFCHSRMMDPIIFFSTVHFGLVLCCFFKAQLKMW